MSMTSLENLLIVGVRENPDLESTDLEEGTPHYYLNLWSTNRPDGPSLVPVGYRGGYTGGFNHVTALDRYLLVADGESILAYNLTDPSMGYAELTGVDEISVMICMTPSYLVSCLDNLIQVRSFADITQGLRRSSFNNEQIEVPFRQTQHQGQGDTALSMITIPGTEDELVLLNNANDKTYMINPKTLDTMAVQIRSKQQFPNTFQRQQKYHFLLEEPSRYTVFTESTFHQFSEESEHQHPNRVYSFDIRGPPTLQELESLVLENRRILSMVPTLYNQLTLLIDHNGRNYIETLEPNRRKILNSRPLNRRYELGDRLQQVDNALLIVRHLKNEIVDVATEDSIRLTGAENDVPIPEISSTWEIPQYLCVTKSPTGVR